MNFLDNLRRSTGVLLHPVVSLLVEQLTWWLWRRWRIYCPRGSVSHLFERPDFQRSLIDYDEAYVSPCTMNEHNCGGVRGKWTPKVAIMPGMEMAD